MVEQTNQYENNFYVEHKLHAGQEGDGLQMRTLMII